MEFSSSSDKNVQNSNESTLIDYFVVAGYDHNLGLQVDTTNDGGVEDLSRPPLHRSFIASIIAYYPQRRAAFLFPQEIVSLCMPKGLQFFLRNNVPSPSVHTFANIREDGSRLDGSALIYYEEVRDVALREKMSQLHMEHVRALTEKGTERVHFPPGTISGGTHTLPRGNKKDRAKRISYYDAGGNSQLYMSKCICLVNRIPIVSAAEHILMAIHSIFTSNVQPPPLPLESYIYWILNEVPLPARGSTLKVCLNEVDIVIQRPGPLELPFFDHYLSSLFDLLTVDKFLRLFTCFLLEHQILLCSKSFSRLMLVAESLCALAFPFRWQLTYVPILPYSQLKFMEAPVPFIMGVCYEDIISDQLFQCNMCVLDIDTGDLNMPEDVPLLPDRSEFAREVANVLVRFEERIFEDDVIKKRTTKTCLVKKKDDWTNKRMSRSFDEEFSSVLSQIDSATVPLSRNNLSPLPLDDVLKQSEVFARVAAIARRAGVSVQMDSIEKELLSSDNYSNSPICKKYFKEMKINNAIREVFLNRFAWLLYSYEHFVISGGYSNCEAYYSNRDSVANFDKAAFLSDQPDSNLAFLAAFLETQMFTSFIDLKIISQWETPDENLQMFDARIQALRENHGLQMVRTPTYEKALPFIISDDAISKREEALDYIVPLPHVLPGASVQLYDGTFPELNASLLEGLEMQSPLPSPWKQRHRRLRPKNLDKVNNLILDSPAVNRSSTYITDTPLQIAQQNLKFVEQLLKETKGKTKRMLVGKMGKEALQLGHGDAVVNGLEENTLVASFCDLLERIWAHGLIKKQGKSSLWAHILHHQELEKSGALTRNAVARHSTFTSADEWSNKKENINMRQNEQNMLSELVRSMQKEMEDSSGPAWSLSILRAANFIYDKINAVSTIEYPVKTVDTCSSATNSFLSRSSSLRRDTKPAMKKSNSVSDFAPYWVGSGSGEVIGEGTPRKRNSSRTQSPDIRKNFPPLPMHIAYDLRNVLRMAEIKTDIGYARAFVRLSLERKLLHSHLKTILSNTALLQQIYKKYAFLRSDDEKEQFLYHILSLNAAEFRCFTNTFCKTKMFYRVLLVMGNTRSVISCPIFVVIAGSLCSTTAIEIKQNIIDFKFEHKNLGILSTLRVGHNEKDMQSGQPKWFLDYILVRNEITGQCYRFNCCRWFGKGVDDGSLERLLVAEKLPQVDPDADILPQNGYVDRHIKGYSRSRTPPRTRSPSTGRSDSANLKSRTRLTEIQQLLGEAVNAIVKHFYNGVEARSELTQLLCAPDKGLVSVMVSVFLYGRQDSIWSTRFFRQQFPWDYVEKVFIWFYDLLRMEDSKQLTQEQRALIIHACRLVRRISSNSSLGKDGKFQLFIITAIRDHVLSGLLPLMAWTPITAQLYEELSFLRTPHYLNYLSKLLNSLNEYNFDLEKSLTYGID